MIVYILSIFPAPILHIRIGIDLLAAAAKFLDDLISAAHRKERRERERGLQQEGHPFFSLSKNMSNNPGESQILATAIIILLSIDK